MSFVGLGLVSVSIAVMLWLANAKRETGEALGSRALIADAHQTRACWYLSAVALAGLALQAHAGQARIPQQRLHDAALRLADNCVVQGLETDAERVETARATIRASGVYGPVSVIRWSGKKLPYVDNLATLVVCEDTGAAAPGELMRVLRPFGAAVVKRDGKWKMASVREAGPGDEPSSHYDQLKALEWLIGDWVDADDGGNSGSAMYRSSR